MRFKAIGKNASIHVICTHQLSGDIAVCPECSSDLVVAFHWAEAGKFAGHPGVFCPKDPKHFQILLNVALPEPITALLALLNDQQLRDSLPVVFRLKHAPFVIELQYFLDIADSENYLAKRKLLAFAVTSDGNELLVDISDECSDIYQCEHENIDTLGITLQDLLAAEHVPLA